MQAPPWDLIRLSTIELLGSFSPLIATLQGRRPLTCLAQLPEVREFLDRSRPQSRHCVAVLRIIMVVSGGAGAVGQCMGRMQSKLQSAHSLCPSQLSRPQPGNRCPCSLLRARRLSLCRGRSRCRFTSKASWPGKPVWGKLSRCHASWSDSSVDDGDLVGEDAAFFDVKAQTTKSWTVFTGLLVAVLALIYVVRSSAQTSKLHLKCAARATYLLLQAWVDPHTGSANQFLNSLKAVSSNPEVVMLLILAVFAGAHSGLAYLRPYGETAQDTGITV